MLSIGRVQTPTLALIVNRQLEIENFIPQPYWELKTIYRDTTFSVTKGRYESVEEGQQSLATIIGKPFTVTDVTTKNAKEAPPRLFDLTSLQVECNKKFSFSAEETLQLIQSLYEKKVTTYPRVDTTYLSDDIYPKVKGILGALHRYDALVSPLLKQDKLPKSKKVFDNSKVTDHHAIIPTNVKANNLTDREMMVYDLVARRFIAAFYPDCQVANTTVLGRVEDVEFKVTGRRILSAGWRVVFGKDDVGEESAEGQILPEFVVGESGAHEPSLTEKQTQPPKPYTEATLLRAMETAGKSVDDEVLRDALKENGIGRPSTRAAIIEILFKRRYIRKERKSLIATPTGVELIQTIRNELLKSVELTGQWENKLRRIERSEYEPANFLDELKSMVNSIVIDVLSDNTGSVTATPAEEEKKPKKKTTTTDSEKKQRKPREKKKNTPEPPPQPIICPKCGKGHVIKGRTAYGCSAWQQGCDFRLSFDQYSSDLSYEALRAIIDKLR